MIKSNSTIEEHWFFGPVLKQRQYYIQVILASICINLFAIVSAFFIMTVYDRVIPNDAFETLGMLNDPRQPNRSGREQYR